ncbi:hypothetical protein LOZ86_13655 [Pectobacterium parvum]|uniref:hypothetical protein n=1 Tax=Pectobacterium TaxID=122277 RepID=UPI000501B8F6|nr:MULTISPECIES: hypothetical protein [Pectobacterium]GKW44195.1 hypothetical protein PEC301879_40530 [Pectobacterium carotovorum subsp. carotovorum]KFX10099.1 hypothetical protein KP17_20340 [Pectobacterium parvum]MCU1803710.1 hypothetical protein [Pectobacterium parvum]UFK38005.1 hypothetical protein LOZ86_13655 [Pectobacterium parvum]UVD98932.1 hypothetical protein NV347_08070 [Pectobacterium parvum]
MLKNNDLLRRWLNPVDILQSSWSEKAQQDSLKQGAEDELKGSPLLRILDESDLRETGTLREVVAVCRELGKTDASLGWLVGVANSAWSMRANFPLPDEVSADMRENAMLSMVLGRPGKLKPATDGQGWCLNGSWKYASGYPCSSHFFCLAAAPSGEVRVVLVPSNQMIVVADWQSTGLVGTQSVTVEARDIAIPETFTIAYAPVLSGNALSERGKGSYARYFTGVLMNCLPATLLGATESGIELVLSEFNAPVAGSSYTAMSNSGAARYEIGRLCSTFDLLVRAAEYNASVIDSAAQEGRALESEERVAIRGRATQIMRGCVDIVQALLWLRGSSALEKNSPLEKIWRDVNVGARHGGFAKLVPEELEGISALKGDLSSLTQMY